MAFRVFSTGEVLTAAYLNDYLMEQAVITCTSGTRPASPNEGMVIYQTDTDTLHFYTGAAWKRFAHDAETFKPVQATEATTQAGITSTSYAAGSPACGVAFVVPRSGAVFVTVSGRLQQDSNTDTTDLAWEIRTGGTIGSGTVIWAASANRSIYCGEAVNASAPAVMGASHRSLLETSLTAGSTYNVQTMHRVSGGTGQIYYRSIIVEPVL